MLEVIDKGSATDSHPVPLLFVHGTWHAAWCWDEHFLDFFADKGYRAVALSLRGHGASSLSKPLKLVLLPITWTTYTPLSASWVPRQCSSVIRWADSSCRSTWSRTMLLRGCYLLPRRLVVGVRGHCGHSSVTHG